MAAKNVKKNSTAATVGYEAQLWQMADALRGSMDAAGQTGESHTDRLGTSRTPLL